MASLVTVPSYKEWQGLDLADTKLDAALADAVEAASDMVESYCRRHFLQAVYPNELLSGNDSTVVIVRNPPIDTTQPVAVSLSDGGTVTAIDSSGVAVYAESGIIELTGNGSVSTFPRGSQNVSVSYTGGYATIPMPVEEATKIVTAMLFFARGRDPLLSGTSAGQYSRSVGMLDASGLPSLAVGILARYRRWMIVTAAGRGESDGLHRRWV